MRSTNIRCNDIGERGIFRRLAALTHAAWATREPTPPRPPKPAMPGLFERFDRWAARQRQRDREDYLAQSKDVLELERRIRELERNHSNESFGR